MVGSDTRELSGPLRLAELLASVSLATDLGTGQPLGHALRTCTIATALAEAMGCGPDDIRTVHQFALLRFLGCTSDSAETAAEAGGDDLALLAAMAPAYMGSGREKFGRFARSVARGQSRARRLRLVARALADPKSEERSLSTHCEIAAMLAARVGLEESVVDALAHAYERWDGKGFPAGLEGEAIPLAVRIVVVARDADLAATLGEDPRVWMGERRGKAYDPSVVDAFEQVGPDVLSGLDGSDEWETALAGEPDPVVTVGEHTLDAVLAACADFADLKSAWIRGHSRSVASLAEQAGHHAGLDDSACHGLRRAGLVHDIGRVAIENGIWDKPVRSRPRSGSACGFTRTTRRGSSSAATRLLPSSDLLRPTTSASMGRGTTARCAPRRCRPPTESWRPRTCLPLSPPTARTVRHSRPTMPLAPSKPSAASTLLQSAVCSPQPASGRRRGRPAGPRTSRTERWRCFV